MNLLLVVIWIVPEKIKYKQWRKQKTLQAGLINKHQHAYMVTCIQGMGETNMCSGMFQKNIYWQNSFLGEKNNETSNIKLFLLLLS